MSDDVEGGVEMPAVVREVGERFRALPEVAAVALGGSRLAGTGDEWSDFDLYVFVDEEIPPPIRAAIASAYDDAAEIDNRFFGPGDEWRDARTGIKLDVIYWSPRWFEDQVDRVLVRHEAAVGYSTCFWHTARRLVPLFDRTGWLAALKAKAAEPYPEELRRAVIAMNYPILRQAGGSFLRQIALAAARRDVVSVQHRVTALLASYFDVLFAVNRLPHPGEKRLLEIARRDCADVPRGMEDRVEALIAAGGMGRDGGGVVALAHAVVDGLDDLLQETGMMPAGVGRFVASEEIGSDGRWLESGGRRNAVMTDAEIRREEEANEERAVRRDEAERDEGVVGTAERAVNSVIRPLADSPARDEDVARQRRENDEEQRPG